MITPSLRAFVDHVVRAKRITAKDLQRFHREIAADGLASREEADMLVALDRAVRETDPAWADCLTAVTVEFVVWVSRPTGYVDADTARWLIDSLTCGIGPTETARRIAFEVVKEAQQADEALLAFVLRDGQRSRRSLRRKPVAGEAAA